MKKSLFAMVAVGAVTLASCSNDEMAGPAINNDGTVIITAQLPTDLQSRAYGDGTVAKTLHYAVYEGDDVIFASDVDGSPAPVIVNAKNFTLSLNLVKGKTYDLLFWADATTGSPYTFTSSSKSVTVTYDNLGNNENRDAFFQAVKGLTVTGPVQQTVQLRRPFAQVNIGTNDFDAAQKAGVEVATTTMTVSGVYDTLNLFTGVASASEDDVTITYTAAVPEDETFPVNGYEYLAMNYILSGTEVTGADVQAASRELIDITYKVTCTDGHEIDYSFTNVPVQRNYRTNIYGSLLTNPADFNIVVIPGFNDPDLKIDAPTTADGLKVAIEAGLDVEIAKGVEISIEEPLVLADGQTVTVNGTLSGPKNVFTVPSGAEVTIKGEGEIKFDYASDGIAEGGTFAVNAIDIYGKATIEGLTISCEDNHLAGSLLYCNENSEVILNDVIANTGYRALTTRAGSKITINGGEYNSTSHNGYKASNGNSRYAYAVVIDGEGAEATLNNVTITGIQGAFSVQKNCKATINGGDYRTFETEETKGKAFYAVYTAQNANVIITDGKFYSPKTACFSGDNDIKGDPFGAMELRGGKYSSLAWSQGTQSNYPLPEGYEWKETGDSTYPYEVVEKSE